MLSFYREFVIVQQRTLIPLFRSLSDTRLPETHTKEEERGIEVEANRMLKWKKMTKAWNKYHGAEVKHRSSKKSVSIVWLLTHLNA